MTDVISVTVSTPDQPSLLQGPVSAIVTVRNVSENRLEFLLPYPNPNNLAFECGSAGFAKKKEVPPEEIDRSIPVRIPQGGSYSRIYYLNRYLAFQESGEANISYQLKTAVRTEAGDGYRIVTFRGEFAVRLVAVTQERLRTELANYASRLGSNDRQVRMEAAEALAFLDTPLSVDYVTAMLSVDNLEVIGIRALAHFPSPKTYELISGMLSHRDSAVVGAALDEIDRLKIPIQRTQIRKLLTAENPNTRWLALGWLAARPDKEDLPSVTPLLKDENSVVRERAGAYADDLSQRK